MLAIRNTSEDITFVHSVSQSLSLVRNSIKTLTVANHILIPMSFVFYKKTQTGFGVVNIPENEMLQHSAFRRPSRLSLWPTCGIRASWDKAVLCKAVYTPANDVLTEVHGSFLPQTRLKVPTSILWYRKPQRCVPLQRAPTRISVHSRYTRLKNFLVIFLPLIKIVRLFPFTFSHYVY